jgi:hypothetical protein
LEDPVYSNFPEKEEYEQEDFLLPSYEDALRLLPEPPEMQRELADENDLPPCYEDLINN